jgi:DNA-binding GntR family transcriptional regulator
MCIYQSKENIFFDETRQIAKQAAHSNEFAQAHMRAVNGRDAGVNLTQGAYEQLRSDILSCRLLPGSKLKIQELCIRCAVSLGAIREALSRLTSEGLVVARPQRGFRAAPISPEDLTDLTKVRIEIDSLCLRKAIEHGDVDWESRLVAAFHRLSRTPERAAGDPTRSSEEWAEAHAGFHTALVEGCDSPWLMRLHNQLYDQSERYRRLSVSLAPKKRNIGDEHQRILDAVLARDASKAVKLLSQHLTATAGILLDAKLEELPQKRRAVPVRRAAR